MPSGDVGLASENDFVETKNELRIKKGIGALDAALLSIGFTTTNLQHLITPVAEGGIGISLASEGALATSLVAVGVSTIVISGFITYYVFQLIDRDAEEAQTFLEKQRALKEQEISFFARLLYLQHLIYQSNNIYQLSLNHHFKTHLGLPEENVDRLSHIVDEVYQEEKGFSAILHERGIYEVSEEKMIEHYLQENVDYYLPRIQQSLQCLYPLRTASKKSWQPEVMGLITGFISFVGMSSGFIGTYYSIVSLLIGIGSVSLAIPMLGWAIFGASIVFGLVIGLMVRSYTDKSVKREEAIETINEQKTRLNHISSKVHDLEISLLNDRLNHSVSKKPAIPRSKSWSGRLFDRRSIPESKAVVQSDEYDIPILCSNPIGLL